MSPILSALLASSAFERRQQSRAINPGSYLGSSDSSSPPSGNPLRAGLIVCGVVVGILLIALTTIIVVHHQNRKARAHRQQAGSAIDQVAAPQAKPKKMFGWWKKSEEDNEKSARPVSAGSGTGTVKTDDDIPSVQQRPERGFD